LLLICNGLDGSLPEEILFCSCLPWPVSYKRSYSGRSSAHRDWAKYPLSEKGSDTPSGFPPGTWLLSWSCTALLFLHKGILPFPPSKYSLLHKALRLFPFQNLLPEEQAREDS